MDASTRLAFNMKVLRRHDRLISDIVESASFVVLYEHVDQQWQKLDIQGPMFLFKRSAAPTYGFFILNRNGLENFSKSLLPKDDLETTDNFIIYQDATADRVLGLWVYEPEHLKKLGAQMTKLKNLDPEDSDATAIFAGSSALQANPTSAPSQAGQSVSLDQIFGTAAVVDKQEPTSNEAGNHPRPQNGMSLLDSIFKSAGSQQPRPPSASQLPDPTTQIAGLDEAVSGKQDKSDDLKALLGLGSSSVASPLAPAAQARPSAGHVAPGLEALFASARLSPAGQQASPRQASNTLPPPSNHAFAPQQANGDIRPVFAQAVDGAMAGRGHSRPGLSRTDFVRELLSLIHTDPAFVNDVYHRYLTHVS